MSGLSIKQLRNVARVAVAEADSNKTLCLELARALGPCIVVEGNKFLDVIDDANYRLDVLARTGRLSDVKIDQQTLQEAACHREPSVRLIAARMLDHRQLTALSRDKVSEVRHMALSRAPLPKLMEAARRDRDDDVLHDILQIRLTEAGIKTPAEQDKFLSIYDEKLGDAAKQDPGPELSDAWYESLAQDFVRSHGRRLEEDWEEIVVRQYCLADRSMGRRSIDGDKLLKAIKDRLEDRDDRFMKKTELEETLDWLKRQADDSMLFEMTSRSEPAADAVDTFVSMGMRQPNLLGEAEVLFSIKKAVVPAAIRKHRLGESNALQVKVPVVATLPHRGEMRHVDERALDMYCEAWTRQQALVGEPLRLEWHSGSELGRVSFVVSLK